MEPCAHEGASFQSRLQTAKDHGCKACVRAVAGLIGGALSGQRIRVGAFE